MFRIFTGSLRPRRAALVVVEHALIVLSVVIAAIVRFGWADIPAPPTTELLWRAVFIAMVLQVSLHYCDLYDLRTLSDRRELVTRLLQALAATSIALALIYYWIPGLVVGRGVFALAFVPIVTLVVGWRSTFDWLALNGHPTERLVIVGTGDAAVRLARELFERRSEFGVELVGFIDNDPAKVGSSIINPRVIGVISDIPSIVRRRRVDRVIVSLADARGKLPMDELLAMKLNDGVRFDHLASVYEEYTGKIAVENLRPSWLVFSDGFRKSRALSAAKRLVDIMIATVGLLLAGPIMAMVAAAIRLESIGPILYSQQRVGKNGHLFTIHKFRSMRTDAEAQSGAVWSIQNDPRVTKVGRVLRRTRLDEIPQLWNVLIGEMSIVGPRPERPEFVAKLSEQIPYYGQRNVVRPGVTGWAQVRHGYGSTVEDALEKLQYDLFYIKHLSISLDVLILVETIKTVLVRSGS